MSLTHNDCFSELKTVVKCSTAGAILSKLWRKTLKDRELHNRLPLLVNRYLNNNYINLGSRGKVTSKKTLEENIVSEEMSIKVFIDLYKNLLGSKKVKFIIFINSRENKFVCELKDGSSLAILLKDILNYFNFKENKEEIVKKYLNRNYSPSEHVNKKQILNSYLKDDNITFNTFIYCINNLIVPNTVEYFVEIKLVDRLTSVHGIKVIFKG